MTAIFVRKDTAAQALAAGHLDTFAFVQGVNVQEQRVVYELDWLNRHRGEVFFESERQARPMIRACSFEQFADRFAPYHGDAFA